MGSHGMESARQWNLDAVPISGALRQTAKETNPRPSEALGCKGFSLTAKAAVLPKVFVGWSTGVMSQVGSSTSP